MAAEDIVFVNGKAHSHASLKMYAASDPVPFTGIKSLDYDDGLDPGEFRGTNVQITRTTLGEYSASGSMEMRIDEARRLIDRLGNGWMALYFNITASRIEEGMDTLIDELYAVRLKKAASSSSEGKDATTVKFDLFISLIVRNGVLPFPGAIIPNIDVAA